MAATKPLQDMPPQGGYQGINWKRVPAKTYFSGYTMIVGYLAMTAGAAYIYYLNVAKNKCREIENRSADFAIQPLLIAEADRALLRQLRRNRDEEADLMKNVPGWEVGTWFGESIYKTTDDKWQTPTLQEVYVHAPYRDFWQRLMFNQLS